MAMTEQAAAEQQTSDGRVIQIIGPVVDVEFPPEHIPEINTALEIAFETPTGEQETIVAEVAQHIGDGTVRAICMRPTDGLRRGAHAHNTGAPITVPVGNETLGHVWNVIGQPLDTASVEVKER